MLCWTVDRNDSFVVVVAAAAVSEETRKRMMMMMMIGSLSCVFCQKESEEHYCYDPWQRNAVAQQCSSTKRFHLPVELYICDPHVECCGPIVMMIIRYHACCFCWPFSLAAFA